MKIEKIKEPYVYFFPLGVMAIVSALVLWLLNLWGVIAFYPRFAHGNILFFAGLWSFVCGFLGTAIPRMTATMSIRTFEIFLFAGLIFLQVVVNFLNFTAWSALLFLVQLLALIYFVVRRFLIHRKVPFVGFYFVPFAFVNGFLGVLLFFTLFQGRYDILYLLSGELFLLNLILGIGSRLVPVITRLPNESPPDVGSEVSRPLRIILPLAISLNFGYWLEIFHFQVLGASLQILSIGYVLIFLFGILRQPTVWGVVGMGLKLASFMMLVPAIFKLFGQNTLAAQHIFYIAGILFLTLLVATRVRLAHGGIGTDYELRSKRLLFVGIMIVSAAAIRFIAGPQINSWHVPTSVVLLLLALIFWLRLR